MNMKLLFCLGLPIILSGCADPDPVYRYSVVYDSVPQSATVVCGDEQKGYTPLTLYYSARRSMASTVQVTPCKAIWTSGVEADYVRSLKSRKVARKNRSKEEMQIDMQFDFQRKESMANRRQDAQYKQRMLENQEESLRLQKQALQRR